MQWGIQWGATALRIILIILFIGPADSDQCTQLLSTFQYICNDLDVPLATDKIEGSLSKLTLGHGVDSVEQCFRLPVDKLKSLLSQAYQAKTLTLRLASWVRKTPPKFFLKKSEMVEGMRRSRPATSDKCKPIIILILKGLFSMFSGLNAFRFLKFNCLELLFWSCSLEHSRLVKWLLDPD